MQTLSQKLITNHQWLEHSLYGQNYWDTPSLEEKKALPNCGNKEINVPKKKYFRFCCNSFEVYEMTTHIYIYMSLVFGDEFLAQGLHLKSHQRC